MYLYSNVCAQEYAVGSGLRININLLSKVQDKGQSKTYIRPVALANITAFCLHVSSAKLY